MTEPRPVLLILGPTAAGKTALAVELARRIDGECVCADSMQVYRGMDIGTAKPSPAERAAVPHHLLDLLEPAEDGFSVDRWLRRAEAAIADIRGRGRYPIVVGGTSLYVQALLEGLFEGPAPDPQLRARLAATEQEALRRRLEAVDPEAAARIHRNDRRRTIRALEVHGLTGRPISAHQQQWQQGPPRRDVRIIGLDFPVPAINARINARVKAMVAAGLVEEVRGLLAAGVLGRQASEAVGYREIADALAGGMTLEDAIERIKIRTRRLGRQQRTWLRRFRAHPQAAWIDASRVSAQELVEKVLAILTAPPPPAAAEPATADPSSRLGERLS